MDQTNLETYLAKAKAAGCSKEQLALFVSYGYVALPQFLAFHAMARLIDQHNGVDEILLDGTRGSAKSHAVIAQVGLDDCQRAAGLKCLFLRQTEKAASESFDDLIGRVFRGIAHTKNSEKVSFPNGSRIIIGGFKDESDIDKFLGIEYDVIVVEEGTQLSGKKLEMMRGSLRTSRDDWTPRMYLTTNPGGIGHAYFKQRYITPNRQGKETFARRYFSSYKNNPFINVEYKRWLDGLQGELGRQWRDADWDVFAGMAFPSWRHDLHVIHPMEIPAHYIRITGEDWGSAKPFCYLWTARNPDNGRVVVYRELYEAGLTDPRQVELIKASEDPGEKIRKRYADPSMWSKDTRTAIPTSSYDVYLAHGIYLTKAINDRIAGKRKIDAMLEPLSDGLPGLLIFETCFNLIRTLPLLQYDKVVVEDVDTEMEDHAYDALRYSQTDARAPVPAKPKQRNPWELVRSI